MKGFEDVTLGWGGEEFTVPANRQLMLIAGIEEALAGASGRQAIDVLLQPNGPPMARLAQAYGAALRYAGADVSDDEVYLSIMGEIAEGEGNHIAHVQASIMALLSIIAPPVAAKLNLEVEEAMAEGKKPKKKPAAA